MLGSSPVLATKKPLDFSGGFSVLTTYLDFPIFN